MDEPHQFTPLWVRLSLGLACAAAIVAAILVVGRSSSVQQATQRTLTAERGVVQSTVSGSGSLQPARQVNVNFKTGGTLVAVYVTPGEHAYAGQLLAELDSHVAAVNVQQAQASLQAAEAKLAQVQSNPSGSSSSSASGSSPSGAVQPSASSASVTDTSGAQATLAPAASSAPAASPRSSVNAKQTPTKVKQTPSRTSAAATPTSGAGGQGGSGTPATSTTTPASPTTSPATQAANLASAQAGVASAELSLQTAEMGLADTKLYSPAVGTVASVANDQPGDTVSAGATGGASTASASSSGGSGAGSGAAGNGATAGGGGGGATSSASGATASSSAFIVLVDLSGMDLVVPFSESDIPKVKVGQPATVTVNAAPDSRLEAHVSSVATLPITNSGVVSYNVTLHLDQLAPGLRPGMSASAQVIVSQAQGAVSVPSAAISRAAGQPSVTVVRNGQDVVQPVVTGIVGDSTTQVLAGLSGGEHLVLTTVTNLGTAGTGTGGLPGGGARALGGGGFGGGLGGPAGGGGGSLGRGGGG